MSKTEIFESLKLALADSFQDHRLDPDEKSAMMRRFMPLDPEQRAFVRNRAFDLVAEVIDEDDRRASLRWLSGIVRLLDSSEPEPTQCESFFSPGHDCLTSLLSAINHARQSLEICVFTISDNRISDAIIAAKDRGVNVRVITDNDKTGDRGSDVERMIKAGVQTRIDDTRHHMHHKFMLADGASLVTGSFNWTRSASSYNHENIIVLNDASAIADFSQEFESLWREFSSH